MAAPALSNDGTWLICTIRQGRGVQPLPGLSDDAMTTVISVDHIVALTDHICHDAEGTRVRTNVNILLQTGNWITAQGTRAQFAALLGIT
jgi:hypothetical protein